jgi:hypothetical protein
MMYHKLFFIIAFLFSQSIFAQLFSLRTIEIEYILGKHRTATTSDNYKERVSFKVVSSDYEGCLDGFYDDFFISTPIYEYEEFVIAVATFKFDFFLRHRLFISTNGIIYNKKKQARKLGNDNIYKKLTCLFDFYYPCKSFYHNAENE